MKQFTLKNIPTYCYNKDFQTILINVTFPFIMKKEDVALCNLLPSMLQCVSKKYPTEREFTMELQNLYILNALCSFSSIGDMGMICFNYTVPDTFVLKEDLLDKQFAFFSEMIYEPKTNGDAFCTEEFNREVESLRVSIERAYKDHGSYAVLKSKKLVDPKGAFSYGVYCYPELLEQVNEKNLYEFYKQVVINNQPAISVFGNVDRDEILKHCNKHLYRKKYKDTLFSFESEEYLPVRKEVQEVVEESNFRNSVYLSYYNVKDFKEEDYILLETIKNLLTSQSCRLLNKKLRDEHDLVYSSSVSTYPRFGILSFMVCINKDNIDLVKEKILEVLTDLKNEDMVEENLNLLKERYRLGMIRQLDDKASLFQDFITKEIGVDLTSKEYYEKLCKIHSKDISKFMNRLILNTNYFLKEGEHE